MATSVDKKIWRPTEEQRRAIASIDRPMAVDAAAGSGKTSVLIRRILAIIGADPDCPGAAGDWSRLEHLLAITFTTKAAGQLRAKLRPHVPPPERYRLDSAWIGTFHHVCARLLRRHAPRLSLDPTFAIMEENAAKLEANQAARDTLLKLLAAGDAQALSLVEAVEFRTALGALEELMAFRWHAEQALSSVADADGWEREAIAALGGVFAQALAHHRATLARLGALDFQELEIRARELLDQADIREEMQAQFDHLLIDEFQDTNDIQAELVLKIFNPEKNRLFIVGDEAQSIYRFRGANVGCFAAVRRRIEAHGGDTVPLLANFRSHHGIIGFVNECQKVLADGLFASAATTRAIVPGRAPASPGPQRFASPVVELAITSDGSTTARREAEAQAIARFVQGLCARNGVEPGEVVCLFRALTAVAPYEAALRREGIPALVSGGRGLLERQEVIDLMAALTFAADPKDTLALVGLLRSPIVGLSDDDLALLSGCDADHLIDAARREPRLALVDELPRLARHLRPSELMRRIVDASGFEAILDALDPSGGMAANVDRFITVAAAIERQLPIPLADFTAFMGELRAQSARLGDPPAGADATGAVRCMTVHAAKGLEFPVVILPDLFHGESPHTGAWAFSRGGATGARPGFAFKRRDPDRPFDRPEPTERFARILVEEKREGTFESMRLLYVAMTRAMDLLVLPTHGNLDAGGPWYGWVRDTLTACTASKAGPVAVVEAASLPGHSAREAARKSHLFAPPEAFHRPGRRTFTVSQLEAYDGCPKAYEHRFVLGLPSQNLARAADGWVEKELFGLIVHGALAHGPARNAPELEAFVRAACVANDVSPTADIVRRAARQVKTALRLAGDASAGYGLRELAFEWRLDDAVISGSIDWLKDVSGGVEVVDFKTGDIERRRIAERARAYDLQLTAYALAAEGMMNQKVVATTVIFPGPEEVVTIPMTAKRRQEGTERIRRIMDGIRSGAFAPGERPPCETCPYHQNGLCWEDRLKKSGARSPGPETGRR